MIHLDLFLGFLRVGLFAFGGAYGAIPLIRDVVLSYDWLSDEALTYMIAVSESTPGPIMVNLATYVGSRILGCCDCNVGSCSSILYHYPSRNDSVEKSTEESVYASYSSWIKAVHYWNHSCDRRIYDAE